MIRSRNVAYNLESATAVAPAAAAAIAPFFINSFPFPVRVKKVAFHVAEKGSGAGTSYTVDVKKNGTTVLSTVPTLTIASITSYSTKFDTDKTIAATAPTGVSALPVLSSTVSTITLGKGDVLELVVTPNGALATTSARIVATATIEYYPA